MKRLHALCALLLLAATASTAPAASSDPVGALRLRLRGSSDTLVSLPLHRAVLVETSIASRGAANVFTLSADAPGLPAGGAYVLVMSGVLEGAVLPIASLSARTITIEAVAFDLTGLAIGDLVAVVPYWTLDTLFPAGAGIHISPSRLVAASEILLYDSQAAGTNLSASLVYFYFAGNGTYAAGWYRFGDMSTLRGATRLPPQRPFIVRQPSGPDTEVLVTGAVRMSGYRLPITTRSAGEQDNLVALPVAVPVTLDASNLRQSGAFSASPSRLAAQDQLLVFDNTRVAQNKSTSAVYFYFAGNGTYTAGWYRFGDMTQPAGGVVLKPGEGYIIRKGAQVSAETRFWAALPSYLH